MFTKASELQAITVTAPKAVPPHVMEAFQEYLNSELKAAAERGENSFERALNTVIENVKKILKKKKQYTTNEKLLWRRIIIPKVMEMLRESEHFVRINTRASKAPRLHENEPVKFVEHIEIRWNIKSGEK